jgi:predicted nicotinamide N-methyase
MIYSSTLQRFSFGRYSIDLWVPDLEAVKQQYLEQKKMDMATPFPYWAQVWPSAIALTEYIATHPELVQDKNVLELAAGLGLPSMLAANFAKSIICSDYLPETIGYINESAKANQFSNVTAQLLDWNLLPKNLKPNALLLSDINYEPAAFETLLKVLIRFKENGSCIILSTPQRLMAKPFIEKLLPLCTNHFQMEMDNSENISILLM